MKYDLIILFAIVGDLGLIRAKILTVSLKQLGGSHLRWGKVAWGLGIRLQNKFLF